MFRIGRGAGAPTLSAIESIVGRAVEAAVQKGMNALKESLICEKQRGDDERRHLVNVTDGLEDLRADYMARASGSRRQRKRAALSMQRVTALIHKNQARLRALGLIPIVPGDRIDYRLHEPSGWMPISNQEQEGRIVSVDQTGYLEGDRVWRPALVTVLKYVQITNTNNNS